MVAVSDTLPAGLTPVEMTGDGWTCSLAAPTLPAAAASRRSTVYNTFQPQPTCYRFDSLPPGGSYPPITLAAAVADNTQPSVTNDATVAGGGGGAADDTDATAVSQLPQLVVSSYDSAAACRTRRSAGRRVAARRVPHHGGQRRLRRDQWRGHVRGRPARRRDRAVDVRPGWSCDAASAACRTNPGVHPRPTSRTRSR